MRNEAKKEHQQRMVSDTAARWIASTFLTVQGGFAALLSAWTVGLSRRSMQVGLALFCLCFGGMSLYVLSDVFQTRSHTTIAIKPDQLVVPKHYTGTDPMPLPVVTPKELVTMSRFRKYMDSLAVAPEGKRTYDSVLKTRPYLLDSIRMIESFYQSHVK